jgi:hypothetical protein
VGGRARGKTGARALARQEQCWGKGRRAVTSNLKPLLVPGPRQGNRQRITGHCNKLAMAAIAGQRDGRLIGYCWPSSIIIIDMSNHAGDKLWCGCHVTAPGGVCMGSLPCRLVARRLMQIANRTFSSSLGQPTSHRDDASPTLYVIFQQSSCPGTSHSLSFPAR